MQNEDTLTAMEFAGLSPYGTWMHYCNMGGSTDYFELTAYLHGLYDLDPDDADLVSQAVNELIDDVCSPEDARTCRAPYSWTSTSEPRFADVWQDSADRNRSDDAGSVRVPVDDLVGPHSIDTFGSCFLAGVNVSALSGRPGVPLPPGVPVELLGDVLDSRVIGRIFSGGRK